MAKRRSKDHSKTSDETASLQVLWQELLLAHHDAKHVPSFTSKQEKQLSRFQKAVPANMAEDVLRHALTNWGEFTLLAEQQAGALKMPLEPDLGFLLKYAGVAVNDWLETQQETPVDTTKEVHSADQLTENFAEPQPVTREMMDPPKAAPPPKRPKERDTSMMISFRVSREFNRNFRVLAAKQEMTIAEFVIHLFEEHMRHNKRS